MTAALADNIKRGIWYRRKDGGMYGAELAAFDQVRFVALHPNTLEEIGKPKFLPVEHFYCFFCRREQLA